MLEFYVRFQFLRLRHHRHVIVSAGARELEPPKYKCEAPCLLIAGYRGFSTGSE